MSSVLGRSMCCRHISFKTVGGGRGGEGKEQSARDLTPSITRSVTTIETGETMAVPCTCR